MANRWALRFEPSTQVQLIPIAGGTSQPCHRRGAPVCHVIAGRARIPYCRATNREPTIVAMVSHSRGTVDLLRSAPAPANLLAIRPRSDLCVSAETSRHPRQSMHGRRLVMAAVPFSPAATVSAVLKNCPLFPWTVNAQCQSQPNRSFQQTVMN